MLKLYIPIFLLFIYLHIYPRSCVLYFLYAIPHVHVYVSASRVSVYVLHLKSKKIKDEHIHRLI